MDPQRTRAAQAILASPSPAAALLDALLAYGTPDAVNPDVRRQDRELIEAVLALTRAGRPAPDFTCSLDHVTLIAELRVKRMGGVPCPECSAWLQP